MSEQGSPEWFAERLGKVTASRIPDVVAKTKTGWGASRNEYMAELINERDGILPDPYINEAMKWGIEKEPEARAAYALMCDVEVAQVGFIPHPTIPMTGASPDGLVDADGLVEIKCPRSGTHLDTLLGMPIPNKYILQMDWQMACTGRLWCDWVSYDPRFRVTRRLFVQRMMRDNVKIASLERDVMDFLIELDLKVRALQERYDGGPSVLMQQLKASVDGQ